MFARIAVAAVFLVAALAGASALLPDAHAATVAAVPYSAADDAYLADLGSASLVSGDGDELVQQASQVCEGVTARVPVAVMQAGLRASHPAWTASQAVYAVDAARASYCPAPASVVSLSH